MLNTDPSERSTICELLEDPWITNDGDEIMDLFIATKTMSEIILNSSS
jgi:hypothetical protein